MHFPQNSTKKPKFSSRFAISWAKFEKLVTCELIFWSKVTQSQPSCFGSHTGFSISLKSGLKVILVQINSHLGSDWNIFGIYLGYMLGYRYIYRLVQFIEKHFGHFFHPVTPYWTYTFGNKTFFIFTINQPLWT